MSRECWRYLLESGNLMMAMDDKRLKHLKVKLKSWEKEFQAKNGVQPTQHDIDAGDIKILYKEYQSLKSKRHVEGSKSHVVTDSKNSVFGAYLNKEKSQEKKKFSFSAKNTKVLSWSKQSGWTNFQKMPYNNKLPKSECREVNEGEGFESLLPDGNGLKIIQGIPQSAPQIEDTVNVVTTKKHLKFGNSVTAEWMTNDQLSISDASEGDGSAENEAVTDSQDRGDAEPLEYNQPNEDISFTQECTNNYKTQGKGSNKIVEDFKITKSDPAEREKVEIRPTRSTSSVSENYVRLNLKKPTYSRGGVKRTGSYYKRQKWKKKNSSACFKCGQTGHWAKSCTQANTDGTDGKLDQPSVSSMPDSSVVPERTEVSDQLQWLPGSSGVTITTSTVVEPLYDCQESECFSATSEVLDAMKLLGYQSFRMKQEECIMRILSGISTLVVAPTGVGKSFCYQLPAYLYYTQRCSIALVVSPLISLIDNQMKNLPECLGAVAIHSGQSKTDRTKALKSVKSGNIAIVMTTPEMIIESASCIDSFLYSLPPVAFICLDEVHCIAEWSHNFRPSYLRICKVLRSTLNVKCFLGLTATATQQTIQCIQSNLDIPARDCLQDYSIPNNLTLSVSCVQHKEKALVELLQSDQFVSVNSVIIYCNRQQTTERIAQYLRTQLQSTMTYRSKTSSSIADCYHAGLSAAQRKQVQANFMSGRLTVVVATVAFGMGINKQDVRAVIHFDLPNSFEAYVQEIGRAGRDGLDAFCHVFISLQDSDLNELKKHIYANSMDRYVIKLLVSNIFSVTCDCSGNENKEEKGHLKALNIPNLVITLDLSEDCITTLLCILESKNLLEIKGSYPSSCTITNCGTEVKVFNSIPVVAAAAKLSKDASTIRCSLRQLSDTMDQSIAEVYQQLQYCNSINSTILISFTTPSFFVKVLGNMSNDDKDEFCDQLYSAIQEKENSDLRKLHILYTSLKQEADNKASSTALKSKMSSYFSGNSDTDIHKCTLPTNHKLTEQESLQLKKDIQSFLSQHSDETFTGRAIARIFHGINSPRYPAHLWGTGRNAYYWRRHLDVDFNLILQTVTLILTNNC